MLPENVKSRVQFRHDIDGNEISRSTVPADYAWKLVNKSTRVEHWVNADDEHTDRLLKLIFNRPEDTPITHTYEKIGKDGETRYGPADI